MKKLFIISTVTVSALLFACGGSSSSEESEHKSEASSEASEHSNGEAGISYDTARGEGKFKDVQIAATLDPALAKGGEEVYNLKCSSCHKLTDEKLVGPGWKNVTQRHKAEWIMNFVTNTDAMLAKDPKAQAQLEICLVRMPNQNVSDEAARQIYEFMRKNDGVK